MVRKSVAGSVSVTTTASTTTWGSTVAALPPSNHDRVVTLRGPDAGLDYQVSFARRPSDRNWCPMTLGGHPFVVGSSQTLLIRAKLRIGSTALTQNVGIMSWPVQGACCDG